MSCSFSIIIAKTQKYKTKLANQQLPIHYNAEERLPNDFALLPMVRQNNFAQLTKNTEH